MPNLAILGANLRQAMMQPMGIAATVTRAPANAADTLDVEWSIAGDDGVDVTDTETCRWVRRGTALPVAGDDALLLIDSQGDAWAMVW